MNRQAAPTNPKSFQSSEPRLHQLRPLANRKLCGAQPKRVSTLGIQMQFDGDLGVP